MLQTVVSLLLLDVAWAFQLGSRQRLAPTASKLRSSYLDELNVFKPEKKILIGLTTDAWQVGQKKYKDFLAVYKMAKLLQKNNMACVEVPMWEIAQGPHFDDLQRIFESYWIPDLTTMDNLLLQYDLVIVPDPVIAKYVVEAYYEKEAKVAKKKAYYDKLTKQSWGVIEAYPPKERYDYERIKNLSKQKYIRKFPPLATLGESTYKRMKNHGQVEYFSYGVEDFALYLPMEIVPSKRVLVLRYKNRFDTLVQSLVMRGVSVTSAYPITWMKKEWNAQEERMAKEVDVAYFHESHAVKEWRERLGLRDREVVAVCHDQEVAKTAKANGFKHIFYAKKCDTNGLYQAVSKAVEFAKTHEKGRNLVPSANDKKELK